MSPYKIYAQRFMLLLLVLFLFVALPPTVHVRAAQTLDASNITASSNNFYSSNDNVFFLSNTLSFTIPANYAANAFTITIKSELSNGTAVPLLFDPGVSNNDSVWFWQNGSSYVTDDFMVTVTTLSENTNQVNITWTDPMNTGMNWPDDEIELDLILNPTISNDIIRQLSNNKDLALVRTINLLADTTEIASVVFQEFAPISKTVEQGSTATVFDYTVVMKIVPTIITINGTVDQSGAVMRTGSATDTFSAGLFYVPLSFYATNMSGQIFAPANDVQSSYTYDDGGDQVFIPNSLMINPFDFVLFTNRPSQGGTPVPDQSNPGSYIPLDFFGDLNNQILTIKYSLQVIDPTVAIAPIINTLVYAIGEGATFTVSSETSYYPPAPPVTLTVNSPGTNSSGSGSYQVGTKVPIFAGTFPGHDFVGWFVPGHISVVPQDNVNAILTMPGFNLTATAIWQTVYNVTVNSIGDAPSLDGITFNTTTADNARHAGVNVTAISGNAPPTQVFVQWIASEPLYDENSNEIDLTSTQIAFIMPANDIILTAMFAPLTDANNPAIQLYPVTITSEAPNKSGDGDYVANTIVPINAGSIVGKRFVNWTVDENTDNVTVSQLIGLNTTSPITSFTMVSSPVALTAHFIFDTPYTVTIISDSTGKSGDGTYYPNETVFIYAGIKDGYTFSGWSVDQVAITPIMRENASFTMPARDVTVTALWSINQTDDNNENNNNNQTTDPEDTDPGTGDGTTPYIPPLPIPSPAPEIPITPELPVVPPGTEITATPPIIGFSPPPWPDDTPPTIDSPAQPTQPHIPGIPPAPTTPGHSVYYDDNTGIWYELDPDGLPLGYWLLDENNNVWIFISDEPVPIGNELLAPHRAPQTGDVRTVLVYIIALLCGLWMMLSIISLKYRHKKTKLIS